MRRYAQLLHSWLIQPNLDNFQPMSGMFPAVFFHGNYTSLLLFFTVLVSFGEDKVLERILQLCEMSLPRGEKSWARPSVNLVLLWLLTQFLFQLYRFFCSYSVRELDEVWPLLRGENLNRLSLTVRLEDERIFSFQIPPPPSLQIDLFTAGCLNPEV